MAIGMAADVILAAVHRAAVPAKWLENKAI
jgi:hypothetical protein